jgi:hypothetical protein
MATRRTELRALPALNTNYDPPRPWRCCVDEPHECDGVVVGALGATPTCAAGEPAWREAARRRDERLRAWAESPEGRREAAWEMACERRVS